MQFILTSHSLGCRLLRLSLFLQRKRVGNQSGMIKQSCGFNIQWRNIDRLSWSWYSMVYESLMYCSQHDSLRVSPVCLKGLLQFSSVLFCAPCDKATQYNSLIFLLLFPLTHLLALLHEFCKASKTTFPHHDHDSPVMSESVQAEYPGLTCCTRLWLLPPALVAWLCCCFKKVKQDRTQSQISLHGCVFPASELLCSAS